MAHARRINRLAAVAVGLSALAGLLLPDEASALITLRPGQSTGVTAGTTTPALPPKLDLVLLMDTTGSMDGEISNAKNGASSMFDSIRANSPDSTFAVAAFDDYPYSTYGDPGDLPYYRPSDLTSSKVTFQTAVNSLTIHSGHDTPEAQVPALYVAATGSGLTWPTGSIAAGSGISFRPAAAHVIALVSDAPFHGDKSGNDPYAGFTAPSYAEALTALSDDPARVIAVDSSGATEADMSTIGTDTAGARVPIPTTGVGLSTQVLAALNALTYDLGAGVSCGPLDVTLAPPSFTAVAHDSPVLQGETITVPSGVNPGALPHEAPVNCAVSYFWGDVPIDTAVQQVQVVLPSSTSVASKTKGRRIKVTGSVEPNHEGTPVTLTLLRKKKQGRFSQVRTEQATLDASGAFFAKLARPKPGKCMITATFAGDAGHNSSSGTDKLHC